MKTQVYPFRFKAALLAAVIIISPTAAVSADRIALVVGNNNYAQLTEKDQLTSPRQDATEVAVRLRALGFTVLEPVLDGSREAMVRAKTSFLTQAKGSSLALFYFSGHGVQVGDEQFLLPADCPPLQTYSGLKDSSLDLRASVMVGMEEAGINTKVIILDCCRDNPFQVQLARALEQSGKSVKTKSAGAMEGYGPGFFLAFATSPGRQALDGNGARHSPFTAALLGHLKASPGLPLRDLMDEVKATVRSSSQEAQVPWVSDSLDSSHRKFLTVGTAAAAATPSPTAPAVRPAEMPPAPGQTPPAAARAAAPADKATKEDPTAFTSKYLDAKLVSLQRMKTGEYEATLDVTGKPDQGVQLGICVAQKSSGTVNTTLAEHWKQSVAELTTSQGDDFTVTSGTGLLFNNPNVHYSGRSLLGIKGIPNRKPHRIPLRFRPTTGTVSATATFSLSVTLDVYYGSDQLSTPSDRFSATISLNGLKLGAAK